MIVKVEKTKYMMLGGRDYDEAQKQLLSFEIQGVKIEFERVQRFVSLGVKISENCSEGQELEAKLVKEDTCIAGLREKNKIKAFSEKNKVMNIRDCKQS